MNKRMHGRVMTPQEFKDRMEVVARSDDTEGAHGDGDGLMCDVLIALGYGEGVKIWEQMPKWFA